jgi:hypothetical protein
MRMAIEEKATAAIINTIMEAGPITDSFVVLSKESVI